MSDRIEPMVELIHCSHRTVYTNQSICWDPIETERSKATISRRRGGNAKRQSPRVRAWSLWPVDQIDLISLLTLPSRLQCGAAMLLWDEDELGTVLFHSVIYNSVSGCHYMYSKCKPGDYIRYVFLRFLLLPIWTNVRPLLYCKGLNHRSKVHMTLSL